MAYHENFAFPGNKHLLFDLVLYFHEKGNVSFFIKINN